MVYIIAALIATILVIVLYRHIGFSEIKVVYSKLLDAAYWTSYNTVEFVAWFAKGVIIIPGLIFGIEVWYMHFVTLATSSALIWASERKSLPTLVAFNTLWIFLSTLVLTRKLLGT